MKIMGQKKLYDYGNGHADVRSQLEAWHSEAIDADWSSPADIKARYPHASFLADNRVVFNIKGNSYRLDTIIHYETKTVLIKRIGTHAEYNRWNF